MERRVFMKSSAVWHTHPAGQTIIITQGLGWVQRDGGPVEEVKPGDVVFFEVGEKHWHGASAQVGEDGSDCDNGSA